MTKVKGNSSNELVFIRKTTIFRNYFISYSRNNASHIAMDAGIMFNRKMLEMFEPASEVEVNEIITTSPNS